MKTNKDLIIEPNAAIEGRKYSEEKPWSCKYCYWWGGKKKGCSLKQCHYLLPEKKKAVNNTMWWLSVWKTCSMHRILYCPSSF